MPDAPVLIVVEDRHADRPLQRAIAQVRARGEHPLILTADALLAMRLRAQQIDARLTIDGLDRDRLAALDRVALDGVATAFGSTATVGGTDFGAYLQYTLIPAFMRAVRNVTAVDAVIADCSRVILVSGGALVDAARLVARTRRTRWQREAGSVISRIRTVIVRLRAGRATRWVNTTFRALVLEPGFIWLSYLRGPQHRRAAGPDTNRPFLVIGDRFTADVIARLRTDAATIVIAGATQPGRALFADVPSLRPIESFTTMADPFRWVGWTIDAVRRAVTLRDAELTYGPLVNGVVRWHVVAWLPALRHLRQLTMRAVHALKPVRLLTSADVTAYNRVMIDTARASGVPSVGIQHGITGEPNGHSIVHVDTLATWGIQTAEWYRALAPQHASFVATGNPRFDSLATRIPTRTPNPESQTPFTVTVCTGFVSDFSVGASEYENLLMLDTVIAWARQHPNVRVIHKMHPGEERAYYAEAAAVLKWAGVTTIAEPILYDVLEDSDVLVAAYSTTILESIALGTPAIVFDAIVKRRLLPLDELPGVSIALSVDEVRRQLDRHHASPRARLTSAHTSRAMQRYVSDLDGQATARVAALLG